jgi:hypothetical protein
LGFHSTTAETFGSHIADCQKTLPGGECGGVLMKNIYLLVSLLMLFDSARAFAVVCCQINNEHPPVKVMIELNSNTAKLLPDYISECQAKAVDKLNAQAVVDGVKINLATLRISGYSSNPLTAYIWWDIDLDPDSPKALPDGRDFLTKMTQKSAFKDCF